MFSSSFLPLLLSVALIPNVPAQIKPSVNLDHVTVSRGSNVTEHRQRSHLALYTLQTWYNSSRGLWDTTGWWNAANIIIMIGNYAQADPKNIETQEFCPQHLRDYHVPGIESWTLNNFETGYTKRLDPTTNEPHTVIPPNWPNHPSPIIDTVSARDWLDGYYDDDLWWALAWIKAFDVKGEDDYLSLAQGIFDQVAQQWGTHCFDGGLHWSYKSDYISAVTNELFISTAAHLANRFDFLDAPNPYLDWAQTGLAWFLRSGLINDNFTINSGLNERCKTNGSTTWIYDQGVILGGLMELPQATLRKPKLYTDDTQLYTDDTYMRLAAGIAKAAVLKFSSRHHDMLRDECTFCGADTAQAKGIFVRNLATMNRWLDWDHDLFLKHMIGDDISKWSYNMWSKARKDVPRGVMFSANWEALVEPMNATTQSSALDALVAAWSLQVQ